MQGSSGGRQRTLVSQPEYEAALSQYENDHAIQRALLGITHAIACGPECFDETSEFPGKRLAKSDAKALPGRILRVWFEIKNDHEVYLWYVDVMPRG